MFKKSLLLWYVFAFLSGFGGLILELVSVKVLSLHFGAAHEAVAIVIASYMAGMGVGIFLLGRLRLPVLDRHAGFFSCQFLAALSIAWTLPLLKVVDRLFTTPGMYSIPSLQYFLVFFVLLIPTFFISSSIPLIYRILAKNAMRRGKIIGAVYGWNTAGGFAGVIVASFFFIPELGLSLSSLVASSAFLAILIFSPLVQRFPREEKRDVALEVHSTSSPVSPHLLIAMAGVAGFCGMTLEIVWVRILSIFLPNRNYSFGIVLGIYLLGYALGSLWSSRMVQDSVNRVRQIFRVFIILGLFTIITVPLTRFLPDLLYHLRFYLLVPWKQALIQPALPALLMLFPSALLMGMVLPMGISLYGVRERDVGRDVGTLFGVNIVTSIFGSLMAGFILLPELGALRSNLLMGIFYLFMACSFLFTKATSIRRRVVNLALSGVAISICVVGLFDYDILPKPLPVSVAVETTASPDLIFYRETAGGTICVVEDRRSGIRLSYVNNSAVCGTTYDALKTVRMLAHLPLLAHPAPHRVLVIGFGLGVTTGSVLTYPVDQVDCVEIVPAIAEAAPLFRSFNYDALNDPRLSLIGGDGRHWLKRTRKKYDVITCDPTHPALGSGNLYTKEFFLLVKDHLEPSGIFVQYLPFHHLTLKEVKATLATFHQVFPNATLWLGYSHGIMMGSMEPLAINPEEWGKRVRDNRARHDLMKSSLSRVYDWLSVLLMGPEEIDDFCRGVSPVTDNRPILEYPDFSALSPTTWSENVEAILKFRNRDAPLRLLPVAYRSDKDFLIYFDRFFSAKTEMIRAVSAKKRGDIEGALHILGKARRINWDDMEVRNLYTYILDAAGRERARQYLNR